MPLPGFHTLVSYFQGEAGFPGPQGLPGLRGEKGDQVSEAEPQIESFFWPLNIRRTYLQCS